MRHLTGIDDPFLVGLAFSTSLALGLVIWGVRHGGRAAAATWGMVFNGFAVLYYIFTTPRSSDPSGLDRICPHCSIPVDDGEPCLLERRNGSTRVVHAICPR